MASSVASIKLTSRTASKTPEPTWYVASAAAHHMTGNLDLLNSVHHPLVQSLLFAKNPLAEETGGEKPNALGHRYSTSPVSPTEEHAHSTSCVIVGKENCARPDNGLATVSPEGVTACHVCRNSNASVHPPITPQEGSLICSPGEHPTTASSSRCHEVVIQIEPGWLLDSGASLCMTGNPTILEGLHDASPVGVIVANNETLWSDICGRACGDVKLSGIRYFPGLALNLISPGFLARKGCEIIMNGKGCTIKMGRRIIGKGPLLRTNVYSLDFLDGTLLESDCTHCNAHHAD